ncbi:UDP-N-acetylmuramoyl-tripeptide--D-alanyl-D-alanine ligase [Oenococcus alcoholitolerans]|uniref:UDP-N-acetylmuramoyl-tripeptide--D-alanyl-D- alanine ligase n=1 Tax=Oenococcus alcoholitolerans TaxID=931074 RepID=UPI003F72C3F9
MKYTLLDIAKITDAEIIHADFDLASKIIITSVDFDSRKIKQGGLFLPISDHDSPDIHRMFADYTIASVDGHRFIESAEKNGALASFADHEVPSNIPLLLVKDTQLAFWQLAADYLKKVDPKRIAVTGSNGKTTTKDMIAAILEKKYRVHKTVASSNNEIGVPKTILDMPEDSQFLVAEMGMDRPGQLTALSELVKPDLALITMIGEAHIEFFKSRAKIADAKMEIINGLKDDGILVYNGDEPLLRERADRFKGRKITFGFESGNDYHVTNLSQSDKLKFEVNGRGYSAHLLGDFNAVNAAAAIAVAEVYGLDQQQIHSALDDLKVTSERLQLLEGKNQETIISDVYNSNPTAAIKAIDILKTYPASGKKIIVLGDMLELGRQQVKMHERLVPYLRGAAFDRIYLVGPIMKNLTPLIDCIWYPSQSLDDLSVELNKILSKGDVVLLKASHGIHLEKVEKDLR